jgi:Cof subfamily protein (haloacid dehalogenase superfamily)
MTDMRTLYVSDLDGTLMRDDKTLSDKTVEIINKLIEEDVCFTYATARSIKSAREITGRLNLKLPVITRNGTALADNKTGKIIKRAIFSVDEIEKIKNELPELYECGFVSSYFGDEMMKVCLKGQHSFGMEKYIKDHKDDSRMKQADSIEEMFEGEPGYITVIDDKDKLENAYERMKEYPNWECVFQKDQYGDEYWLEICPDNSTKAKAIMKLKEEIGADMLVVFGDSVNDIPMFEIADESYAVENALDEVKKIATGVIGSNNDDCVASYISSKTKVLL